MTLLPSNATPAEIALDETMARIGDIDVPIAKLRDPWKCPVALLPWLAWQRRVKTWNPKWPEDVQRQVIAAAPEVHRYCGTPYAVETALGALNLDGFTLTEWFEQAGTPGTFSVDVELSTRGLTEEEQIDIETSIARSKNTRSHLDQLNIWLTSRGELPKICTFGSMGEIIEVLPYSINEVTGESAVPYRAIGLQTVETITVYPQE